MNTVIIEPEKATNFLFNNSDSDPSFDFKEEKIPLVPSATKEFPFDNIDDYSLDSSNFPPSNTIQVEPLQSKFHVVPIIKPRLDFSFMEPNIEPIVHGLMKNSTSKNLVGNLDQDLINPYNENIMLQESEIKKFDADSFLSDLDKRLTKEQINSKIDQSFPEEKNPKHDEYDVIKNINDIKEIITNKTITQLNYFREPPQSDTVKKKKDKLTNLSIENKMDMINKINPIENFDLLKFREKDLGNTIE